MPSAAKKHWWILRPWCQAATRGNKIINVYLNQMNMEGESVKAYEFNQLLDLTATDFVLTPFDAARWDPTVIDKTDWFQKQQDYFDFLNFGKSGVKVIYPAEEFGNYYVSTHRYGSRAETTGGELSKVDYDERFDLSSSPLHWDDEYPNSEIRLWMDRRYDQYVGSSYALHKFENPYPGYAFTSPQFSGNFAVPTHPSLVGVLGGNGSSTGLISAYLRLYINVISEEVFGTTFTRAEGSIDASASTAGNPVPPVDLTHTLTMTVSGGPWFITGDADKNTYVVAKNNMGFKFFGSLVQIQNDIEVNGLDTLTVEIPVTINNVSHKWAVQEIEIVNDLIYIRISPQVDAALMRKVSFDTLSMTFAYIPDFEILKGKSLGVMHGRLNTNYTPPYYIPGGGFNYLETTEHLIDEDYTYEWLYTIRGMQQLPAVNGFLDPLGGRYHDTYRYLGRVDGSAQVMDSIIPVGDLTKGRTKPIVYPDTMLKSERFSAMRYVTKEKLWAQRRQSWNAYDMAYTECILTGAPPVNATLVLATSGRGMFGVIYADGTAAVMNRVDAVQSKDVSRTRAILHMQPVLLDGTLTKLACVGYPTYSGLNVPDSTRNSAIREGHIKACRVIATAPWIVREVAEGAALSTEFVAQSLDGNNMVIFHGSNIANYVTGEIKTVWPDYNGFNVNPYDIPRHTRKSLNGIKMAPQPYNAGKTPPAPPNGRVEYTEYVPGSIGGYIPESGGARLWNSEGKFATVIDWVVGPTPIPYPAGQTAYVSKSYSLTARVALTYTMPMTHPAPDCPRFDPTLFDNVWTFEEGHATAIDSGSATLGSYTATAGGGSTATAQQQGFEGTLTAVSGFDLSLPGVVISAVADDIFPTYNGARGAGSYLTRKHYLTAQGSKLVMRTAPQGKVSGTDADTPEVFSARLYSLPFGSPNYIPGSSPYDYAPAFYAYGKNATVDKLVKSPDAINAFTWYTSFWELYYFGSYGLHATLPQLALVTDGTPMWWDSERDLSDTRWIAEDIPDNAYGWVAGQDVVNRLNFVALVGHNYKLCHVGGALERAINMEKSVGAISSDLHTYTAKRVGLDKVIMVDKANGIPVEVAVLVLNEKEMCTLKAGNKYGKANLTIYPRFAYGETHCRFIGSTELDPFSAGTGLETGVSSPANPTVANEVRLWTDNVRVPATPMTPGTNRYVQPWRHIHSTWKFTQGIIDTASYPRTRILAVDFKVTGMPTADTQVVLGTALGGELPIATANFIRDEQRKCYYLDLSKTLHDIPKVSEIESFFWIGIRDTRIPGVLTKVDITITFLDPAPAVPATRPVHPGNVDPPVSNPGGGPTI